MSREQYLIGGEWRSSGYAETVLLHAAAWLEKSSLTLHQDAARLVRGNWRGVASTPRYADDIIKMGRAIEHGYSAAMEQDCGCADCRETGADGETWIKVECTVSALEALAVTWDVARDGGGEGAVQERVEGWIQAIVDGALDEVVFQYNEHRRREREAVRAKHHG